VETLEEDPFAAADARDGWSDLGRQNGDREEPESRSFERGRDRDFSGSPDASSDVPASAVSESGASSSSSSVRVGDTALAAATTAAASAALRLSEAAPAFFETFFEKVIQTEIDPERGAPLALSVLVVLALLPEIRNAARAASDRPIPGDGETGEGETGEGETGDGETGDGETEDTRVSPRASPASSASGYSTTSPSPVGVLWSRRASTARGDDLKMETSDPTKGSFPVSDPGGGGGGVLWTRNDDDEANSARRRETRRRRSRRAGGRNGLDDVPSWMEGTNATGVRDSQTGSTYDAPGKQSPGLGPVEDENMENLRFSSRK